MCTIKLGLAAAIIMPAVISAGTYHWTGSVDGSWTNPANWAEGTVPGRYKDSGGNVIGAKGDTVIFGDDLAGNAVTTIDFTNVYSVSNLLTQGSHKYTYGTDAGQFIPLEPFGTFSAGETATTPVAVQVAKLRHPVEAMCTAWNGEKTTVRNNSREEFVMGAWGYGTKAADSAGCSELAFVLEGTGDIRMTQNRVLESGGAGNYFLAAKLTGKLTVDANLTLRSFFIQNGMNNEVTPLEVYITDKGSMEPTGGVNYFSSSRSVVFSGDGVFRFGSYASGSSGRVLEIQLGADATFKCKVESKFNGTPPPEGYPRAWIMNGGAIMTMAGENSMSGVFQIQAPAELAADCFGMRGTYGRVGDMDFLMSDSGKLRYTGAGETMNRSISVTNTKDKAYGTFFIHQYGTGEWNVNSEITYHQGCNNANMYLGGDSAYRATFGGTLPASMKVIKYHSNEWAFAPESEYTGPIEISGGTLVIGKSMHISSLAATGNGVRVIVGDGVALEIDTLTAGSDKKIDFVIEGTSSSLKANNATAGSGMTGVTVNKHPCIFDENKNLKLVSTGTNIWKSAVSGNWSDAANWHGDTLPDLTHDTYIDAPGGDYTVTVGNVGEVTTTNLFINNSGSGKATLFINNGTNFNVCGHTTRAPLLTITEGGRLEVLDSHLWLVDQGNAGGQVSGNSSIEFDHAEMLFRGNSSLTTRGIWASEKTDANNGNLNTSFKFGTGTITFDDNAELRNLNDGEKPSSVYYHHFIPTRAGETSKIQFKGNSRIAFTSATWELKLGGNRGTGIMEIDTTYTNEMSGVWNNNYVGTGTGVGELLIKRGKFATGTYDNFYVGTVGGDSTSGSTLFVTGRVVVAQGGYLNARGQMPATEAFYGVAIGHATPLTGARGTSYVYGEMLLAGTYVQNCNPFIVGTGPNGHGKVHQTGGSALIPKNRNADRNYNGEIGIGIFGGEGLYQLDAGTVTAKYHVYVGGAFTNDLHKTHKNFAVLNQYHDAKGTLKISGGSFTTTGNIILGRDGTGWLELSGDGVVSAAEIVASNTVGQAASGIRLTADANRKCGVIAAGTKLRFMPESKVVVDVSEVASQANPRSVQVWNLDVAPEGLTESQLELEGTENLRTPNKLQLSADGKSLVWNITNGTVLIFR